MKRKFFVGNVLLLLLIVPAVVLAETTCKNWLECYRTAKQVRKKALSANAAADKQQYYRQALALLEQAIAANPEPGRNKLFGFRFVAYYPYLEMGWVYLAQGNPAEANKACAQEKDKYAQRLKQQASERDQSLEERLATCERFAQPALSPQPPTSSGFDARQP